MKICLLANSASIHTIRWAKFFANRGHDVYVISFESYEIPGIKTILINSNAYLKNISLLYKSASVKNIVKAIRPDILHAHYATSYGIIGALLNYHPYIITAWGSDILVAPEKSIIYRFILGYALKHAQIVTTTGYMITDRIKNRRYIKNKKIRTWPFGVDTKIFYNNRNKLEQNNDIKTIISTRRLDDGLDVHLLIEAATIVIGRYPNCRIIIVGDGTLKNRLQELATKKSLSKKIQFVGSVSPEKMATYLNMSDIFISTSPTDGNNISLLEAMACGVYPVVTNIDANKAWVTHGFNGLIFDTSCNNSLAEMICIALALGDKEISITNEINSEIIRKRGSFEKYGELMEDLYNKVKLWYE
ncbi:MAG: glycosyltransferase family 4 protein [Bacteroidetes bacterium]|nr:glycosyltransferase family 4 protein [Bacteroidota bacterium]